MSDQLSYNIFQYLLEDHEFSNNLILIEMSKVLNPWEYSESIHLSLPEAHSNTIYFHVFIYYYVHNYRERMTNIKIFMDIKKWNDLIKYMIFIIRFNFFFYIKIKKKF